MSSNKVHFKEALKKQLWTIIIVIGIVVFYPIIEGGLKTDLELYLWLFLSAISSYSALVILKKQSQEALCPHCKSDLFEIIEVSKNVKLDFNFCPSCGKKVKL